MQEESKKNKWRGRNVLQGNSVCVQDVVGGSLYKVANHAPGCAWVIVPWLKLLLLSVLNI